MQSGTRNVDFYIDEIWMRGGLCFHTGPGQDPPKTCNSNTFCIAFYPPSSTPPLVALILMIGVGGEEATQRSEPGGTHGIRYEGGVA